MVKLLCVSDTVVQQLENAAHLRRRYHDVDLLVSCGDMPAAYLEYISSVLGIPLFYVKGNHDTGYVERPPGGDDLHRRLVRFRGLTFYGLEGSLKYNNSDLQYSDVQVRRWVLREWLFMKYQMRRRGGSAVDVFVTHAPPKGIHDAPDLPHTGLTAFLRFMDWYKPRYMLHGHVHTYDRRTVTTTQYKSTTVMNINPYTLIEIEPLKS